MASDRCWRATRSCCIPRRVRPCFCTWLIVPGIVYAWSRGERLAAIQALLLLLAAIGIDTLGVRRGLKSEYFIFTDPLIILAGAVLLDSLSDLRFHKWAYPVATVTVRAAYRRRPGRPGQIRLQAQRPGIDLRMEPDYLPLLPLPWCPSPS